MSLPRIFLLLAILPLASCSSFLERIVPSEPKVLYKTVRTEHGIASWYDDHRTASGERFDVTAMTAAHRKLPFGTKVRVIDLKTGNAVIVRINDRGPYIRGRIIDLTIGAAKTLGTYHRGIAKVRVEVLREIPLMKKPNLHANTRQDRQEARRQDAASSQSSSKRDGRR